MRTIKYITLTFVSIIIVYFIYLKVPYTEDIILSPYKNATIENVYLRKRAFFEISVGSSDPISQEYRVFYNGKKVYTLSHVNEEEFSKNTIINTNWYKDSVKIVYEILLDGVGTDSVTIKFKD